MVHSTLRIVAPVMAREEFARVLRSSLGPTRVEPGCLTCQLLEDAETPGTFVLSEQWASEADLRRRLRSDGYRQLLHLMELSPEPPEVRFFTVCDTRGMDAVYEARTEEGVRAGAAPVET